MTISQVGSPVSAYAAAVQKLAVNAGNLVVFFASGGPSTPGTPASSGTAQTSAWTQAASQNTSVVTGIWYAIVTVSGDLTVTIAGLSDPGCSLHEYSGVNTASPVDQAGSSSGAIAAASVVLANVAANAVIVMIAGEENGSSTWTALSPYTVETQQPNHSHCTIDQVVTSGGAYTPKATQVSGPFTWGASAVSFAPAAVIIPPGSGPIINQDCHITLTHPDVNGGKPYGFILEYTDKYGADRTVQREVQTDGTSIIRYFFHIMLADGLMEPGGSKHSATRTAMYAMLQQFLAQTAGVTLGTIVGAFANLAAIGHAATEKHYQTLSIVACQFTNAGLYFAPADPLLFNGSLWDGAQTWSTSYWR